MGRSRLDKGRLVVLVKLLGMRLRKRDEQNVLRKRWKYGISGRLSLVCTIARDIRADCSIDNDVRRRERGHERGMEGRKQTADAKGLESMGIYTKRAAER